MTVAPAKYLFDDDFGATARSKPSIALADHETKVQEVETDAYARGFAAAAAAAKADTDQRTTVALERIATALEGFGGTLAGIEAKLETEAVEVAVAVAKKLASELIAREPLAEISALIKAFFQHLVATPHIVVRVNDALHEAARERIEEIMRSRGLECRLVVLAEAEIAPGDCRIEWADGGLVRNRALTAAVIDEAVARYVAARMDGASIENTPGRAES